MSMINKCLSIGFIRLNGGKMGEDSIESNPGFGDDSKSISTSDDSGKQFLKDSLGSTTRGFDIDSIYVERMPSGKYRWTIFELLKAVSVLPEHSHPSRYWDKNGRKFLSLWSIIVSLREAGFETRFILVNYRDVHSKVKVIHVDSVTNAGLTERDSKVMSFSEWKRWFTEFNDNKVGKTWDVIGHIEEKKISRRGEHQEP